MWQWINENAQALSFFTSVGTLLVWLFYAQLLFSGFKRQRQPRLLINQGWGTQIDSVCLISNMSHEPVYIQCLVLTLATSNGEYSSFVTDLDTDQTDQDEHRIEHISRQGPLGSGCYMNLGRFRLLVRQAARQSGLSESDDNPIYALQLNSITVTVITNYGPESKAIGSERRFLIRGENNELLRPATIDTPRVSNRAARRELERWIESLI